MENPTITTAAVGNMSLGQQMSHAKRNGHDCFVSTDGRTYIMKKGKWELQPQPKQDTAYFLSMLALAERIGPDYVRSVHVMAASKGIQL